MIRVKRVVCWWKFGGFPAIEGNSVRHHIPHIASIDTSFVLENKLRNLLTNYPEHPFDQMMTKSTERTFALTFFLQKFNLISGNQRLESDSYCLL
jgi:hypothetical protein